MADPIIIDTNEPPKRHPLQLDYVPGPKGAYELKKTENGIYIRVDMPGVKQNDAYFKVEDELKEIRFLGCANKVDDEWLLVQSNRCYAGTIKLDCQEFNQLKFDCDFYDGTCRFLISGAHNAYLTYRTPHEKKNSESETAANVKQPLVSVSHQPHHNPNNFRFEGVSFEKWHNADCTCCNGNKRDVFLSGPWTEEDSHINPFVCAKEKAAMGVFETKFKADPDASGNYFLYIRMDMPGCTDYDLWVKKHSIFVDGDTGSSTDKFKLDDNDGRRKYRCRITLNCSNNNNNNSSSSNNNNSSSSSNNNNTNNCARGCSFLETWSLCALKDGVFRIQVKILGNNPYKDFTVGERFLANYPYSDPPHDSAECSTTSITPE